jgi:anhydro-N-acetylmuramic acid kinase
MKLLGLMSGTSCDGVDAALVDVVEGAGGEVEATLAAFVSHPYPDEVRRRLLGAVAAGGPADLAWLHLAVARAFAGAVEDVLAEAGVAPSEVAALGSHGHTVWHQPPEAGERGVSLQLGDPATLAALTGIDVVSDVRAADLAAGGHGAPLVPFADRVMLSHPSESRVLLNVGGMANLTWLPRRGGAEAPLAFDTGPGNALLDLAASAATGGALRYDADGALARAGTVDPTLLARLRDDPWFASPPPRSTGRERFGADLVDGILADRGLTPSPGPPGDGAAEPAPGPWADLLATLTAFTATTAADAVARWVCPRPVDRLVVTGGGAHNPVLLRELRRALDQKGVDTPVSTGGAALGIDPDAREAAAFALLAWAHLQGLPGNLPDCTGASGPRVLGSFTPAPRPSRPPAR